MGLRPGIVRLFIGVVISVLVLFITCNWFDDIFGQGASARLGEAGKRIYSTIFRSLEPDSRKLPAPRRDHHITPDTVHRYLSRSLIGSCSLDDLKSRSCYCSDYTFDKRIQNDATDSAVVVVSSSEMVVVSFRPTRSDKNKRTNADAALEPLPGVSSTIKVHNGFLSHYQSIQTELEELIPALLRNNDKTLHITGYSLGGATALVSLNSVIRTLKQHNLNNPVQVFSYASPRVGNGEFADYIESLNVPVVRYTIHNDVVSLMPPRLVKYVHAGAEYFFNQTLHKCRLDYDEDPNCAFKADSIALQEHTFPNNQEIPSPIFC
ncbi:hypothetical protein DSO57_1026347 [Entomophthora muscae]|uniref:Uncharacterized protein n=1 Tax=Entomophthora muscae TaxID=34485 RepID=A0ACC2S4E5_9FUNG|nr:hypothetical protein DSO57_1026347 [Entomophthora muscae]